MAEEPLTIIVRLPDDLEKDFKNYIAENDKADCKINLKEFSQEEIEKNLNEEILKCEPLTILTTWVGLKFIGAAAGTVALNIFSNYLYSKLQKEVPAEKKADIVLFSKSGKVFRLTADEPMELDKLKEFLKEG